MRFILAFLALLFVFPIAVSAAPSATISISKGYANMTFTDLRDVAKIGYTLMYDATNGSKGLEGGMKFKSRTSRTSRRQILGTCSSGKCVFHKGVKNVQLDVTFTLRSGKTVTVSRAI